MREKAIRQPLPLRLTDAAGLAEIWVHISSEASEAVASRFVTAIEAAFEPVRHFPLVAPAREQLAPGLRVTFGGTLTRHLPPLRAVEGT